jgi:hypothetical protein
MRLHVPTTGSVHDEQFERAYQKLQKYVEPGFEKHGFSRLPQVYSAPVHPGALDVFEQVYAQG